MEQRERVGRVMDKQTELKRMQKEALHRHKLAEDNFNRAKDRLERATSDVNLIGSILKEQRQ